MMKKFMRKAGAVIFAAALAVSTICPQMEVSADNDTESNDTETVQTVTKLKEQYLPKELTVKKTAKSLARKEEPAEWNKTEFNVYKFGNAEDALAYIVSGGIKYYNQNYFKNPQKIKITAAESGTLFLALAGDKNLKGTIYDANQKEISTFELLYIKAQVNEGEVYYIDLPENCKEATISAYILENECKSIKKNGLNLQKGEGKETYHTFQMKRRGKVDLAMVSMVEGAGNTSYKVQKNEKGKWVTIGRTRKFQPLEEVIEAYGMEAYGLSAGNYRLVLKASTDQVNTMGIEKTYYNKKKIAYKKSKAKKITAENIYTTKEKAPRWYKTMVKSNKNRKSLKITTGINEGGFKFTIYQKGNKKSVKTLKVSGKRYDATKIVKLPKKKGTYYIKVSKLTKKTNGYYEIKE